MSSREDVRDGVTIRPARQGDAGAWLRLVHAFAVHEKLPPPDAEAKSRLIDHLFRERPLYRLLIAECEGAVVGYAAYTMTYSTFRARPTLFLDDLFVLPDYRGREIGTRLYAYIARTAVAEGCDRLDSHVLAWNEKALAFFRKLGAPQLRSWRLHRIEGAELLRAAEGMTARQLDVYEDVEPRSRGDL